MKRGLWFQEQQMMSDLLVTAIVIYCHTLSYIVIFKIINALMIYFVFLDISINSK